MMAGVGLAVDELQRAAPIVSGFLLGYVAVLPLIGRIADLRGRLPVLVGSLVVFALGSLVTAAAYDLPSMVTGRFLQGVGGGGLVPATLALVADLYPPQRRGVPLGVVGAVQELGSVLGPLYGALVLAVGDLAAIFALNLAVGLRRSPSLRRPVTRAASLTGVSPQRATARPRLAGRGCCCSRCRPGADDAAAARPHPRSPSGSASSRSSASPAGSPRSGSRRSCWRCAFVVRCLTARRPLVDVRGWREVARRAPTCSAPRCWRSRSPASSWPSPPPTPRSRSSPRRPLAAAGVAARRGGASGCTPAAPPSPLVPHGAFAQRRRPGARWWSASSSGAALIAALVDIPIFARVTVYPTSSSTRRSCWSGCWWRCRSARSPAASSSVGCRPGWSPRPGWRSPRSASPGCPRGG